MGEHKLTNRPKQKQKWILCTKWFAKVPKPIELTEEEKQAAEPPKKKPGFDLIPFWTPIGVNAGIPFQYGSEAAATADLKEMANAKEGLHRLHVVACHVKYVPNRIRKYDKNWFDKYVKQEVILQIKPNKKEGDTFNDEQIG